MPASRTSANETDTLLAKLKLRIASEGPLTIAQYMDACLSDPEHGYYATRDPFGSGGDFITAPEISQIFGELIGLWSAVVWQQMGSPAPVRLIELGPGRGTLMADALRAAKRAPEFIQAAEIHLVETSPVLRQMQGEQLASSGKTPKWHKSLNDVPDGAAILIANEFLDALPIRQFEHHDGKWFERCVGVSEDGALEFCSASEPLENPEILPQALRDKAVSGDIAEIHPQADMLADTIATRAQRAPTAALFIDYGHAASAAGDTLQAVKSHEFADPFFQPGAADLTTHVDFSQLGAQARTNGLKVHGPLPQGKFLLALGLKERCNGLTADVDSATREEIASGANRLVDPAQMGELFKVMAFTSKGLIPPPFTEPAVPEQET
jgi:NADH dehydrogenase [ubiquinone] 1 alpha subcomplex assembly factor 7